MHSSRELIRIGALYDQLQIWAYVIGTMVHRPWGNVEPVRRGRRTVDATSLPASMNLFDGAADDSVLGSLSASASRTIYARGWLTDAYRQAIDESLKRYSARNNLGWGRPTRAAAADSRSGRR